MGMKQWLTWGIKIDGADKAAKEIGKVEQATKDTEKSQEALNDTIDEGAGALDSMTGGAISSFKGVVGGAKKAVLGMRTLKGAIAATGVGILVLAVTSLVVYFTKTKKGAEVLQVAMAGFDAFIGTVTDRFAMFGEMMVAAFENPKQAIIDIGLGIKEYVIDAIMKVIDGLGLMGSAIKKVFQGDFSGAFEDAKKGALSLGEGFIKLNPQTALMAAGMTILVGDVGEFVDKVKDAVSAATALEKRAVSLADRQRALGVEFSKSRLEIQKLKMTSDDLNNTTEERIEAAEKASAIEEGLLKKRMALAQEELDIKRGQNSLSESTAEDLQAEADLQIALSDLQIESLGIQTELMMKVGGLRTEAIAKLEEEEAAEAALAAAAYSRQLQIESIMSEDIERARLALEVKHTNELAMAVEHGKDLDALGKLHDAEAIKLEEDHIKKINELQRAGQNQKIDLGKSALGALSALNEAFSKDDEKSAKKAFQRNKKLAIATAVVNTGQAVVNALTAGGNPIKLATGMQFVEAGIAAGIGAAQIASISKTRFSSGNDDVDTPDTTIPPPPSSTPAAAQSSAPDVDFGFLGGGAMGGIQAYVVSNDVSNGLQAHQQLQDQTTL